MNKLNIAILGYGVVGSSVYQIINDTKIANVKYIFDKEEKKDLIPCGFTSSIDEIINDKEIDVVIEVMGGNTIAFEAITKALKARKHVITSNKETVSKNLFFYLGLAHQNNVNFLFEASVGGAMPIIKPLIKIAKYDISSHFIGILNGTCNYILTNMFENGYSFKAILKKAQDLGFAEANPSFDIDGIDLERKAIILANILFNTTLDTNILCYGIGQIDENIIKYAKDHHKTIKMVVEGRYDSSKIELFVGPILIDENSKLGKTKYEENYLNVDFKYTKSISFSGPGAGGLPTASAILSDLVEIQNGSLKFDLENNKTKIYDIKGKYLVYDGKNINFIVTHDLSKLDSYQFVARVIENEKI